MNIGRCRVTVEASGCVDCGTRWADGWRVGRVVSVVIDGRASEVSIPVCARCLAARRASEIDAATTGRGRDDDWDW
jgi:hypothetical protein